jgi:SAM-dependent methyltransferase
MGTAGATMSFYEELYEKHGDSPRALDWSEEGQYARFNVLYEVIDEYASTVLDVGCGLGHFFEVCGGQYTGVDVSPILIAAAREKYPLGHCHFNTLDAMKDPLPKADYVVSSGMFNIQPDDNSMLIFLHKCFNACSIACAVNMLSSRAPNKREDRIYRSPEKMLGLALEISKKVVLRHDYLPNDFTLVLYR